MQDVHCVSSLIKMYFRELPNPLFTYQLYDRFIVCSRRWLLLYYCRCCVVQIHCSGVT